MPRPSLRPWQIDALDRWQQARFRGIVSVVTGGGKTVFALACVARLKPISTLIVVPTTALLDQWWEEVASYFNLKLDEINIITGKKRLKLGAINIAVLNTASALVEQSNPELGLLIVDECHKAASDKFRRVLDLPARASLGLSATPERQYDDGLQQVLIPALGEVIFRYDYADALRDGVIVPFNLRNVVFELEEERQNDYDKLTRSIARSIDRSGPDAPETVALFLRRSRILNLSLNRVRLALKIVASHRGTRTLVFHEDIEACNLIHQVLADNSIRAGVYHSRLRLRDRASMLSQYRRGEMEVLVTCRALDEGFNVPETELGIIAASTATRRQRIQRLGRILRPARGKASASIYTLVATGPEIARLREEEQNLDGVANVSWSRA